MVSRSSRFRVRHFLVHAKARRRKEKCPIFDWKNPCVSITARLVRHLFSLFAFFAASSELHFDSMISKSCVIFAVLPSMMDAEQYLSADSVMAFSTRLGSSFLPL